MHREEEQNKQRPCVSRGCVCHEKEDNIILGHEILQHGLVEEYGNLGKG